MHDGAGLNKYSSRITQPKSQGASQAMLYATGLTEEDMKKPQVKDPVVRGIQIYMNSVVLLSI